MWRDVLALLAYPHVWIRKAAGRLLGLLLSSIKLGEHSIISPVLLIILLIVSVCAAVTRLLVLLPVARFSMYVDGCALITVVVLSI